MKSFKPSLSVSAPRTQHVISKNKRKRVIMTTDEQRNELETEERFNLGIGTAIEFAIAGSVIWLVGFAVVSFLCGWF